MELGQMAANLDSKLQTKCQRGFSLLELVVVLALVGLLTGGGVLLLRRGVEGDLLAESQANIEDARLALQAFLKINGRLPYPYNSGSSSPGSEQVVFSNTNIVGYLPFAVLGINPSDGWRRPIRYGLNTGFLYYYLGAPPAGSTNKDAARTRSCSTLTTFFSTGGYPSPHWPYLEDPSISATRFPISAVLVSGGASKNGHLTNFYDKKTNLRDNNVANGGALASQQTAFIRPLPGTVLAISGGVYDDILVTLDPATLYQWALCTPPLP